MYVVMNVVFIKTTKLMVGEYRYFRNLSKLSKSERRVAYFDTLMRVTLLCYVCSLARTWLSLTN